MATNYPLEEGLQTLLGRESNVQFILVCALSVSIKGRLISWTMVGKV